MPIFYDANEVADLKHHINILKERLDTEQGEKWRIMQEHTASERRCQELRDELERERKKYQKLCNAIIDIFATTDAGSFLQEFFERSNLRPQQLYTVE